MAKKRTKAKRHEGKPVYIEPDEETQEWIKRPETQPGDITAHRTAKRIYNKRRKGK